MTLEADNKRNKFFTDTLLIAVLPVLAYAATFLYEINYAGVFGIPLEFVDPKLSNLVVVLLTLSFLWFIFVNIINWVDGVLNGFKHVIYQRAWLAIPFILILFADINLYGGDLTYWRQWKGLLILICIILVLEYISPLLIHRNIKGYINKLNAVDEDHPFLNIILFANEKFGTSIVVIIMLSLMSLWVATDAGKALALRQENYYVISGNHEMVVLRMYGDKIICSPLDREKRMIKNQITIYKTPENGEFALELEKVGPLRRQAN